MARTLLLDADSFCYSFAAVHQQVFAWTPELYTYKGDFAGAKVAFNEFLEHVLKAAGCSEVRMALSDTRSNFRKRVLPSYKFNRISKDKPVLFRAIREWLEADYQAVVQPHLEGDDLVSMWATAPQADAVVCSIDKDCKTIPGRLYNPNSNTLEHRNRAEAEWFFLTQALMGDRVDGYGGCPGIGPKRALSVIEGHTLEEAWNSIVNAYEKAGLNEAVALENARCARLLRHGDLRSDGAIRLWHPRGEEEWLVMT